jgi:cell division septal protein FtsQ
MEERWRRSGTYVHTRSGMTNTSRVIVTLLVISCIGLACVWFIFVSKFWSVKSIETNDLHDLDRGEVTTTTYDILDHGKWIPWDQRNILFLNTEEVSAALRDRLFVEQVNVDKSYPNVLRLKIVERQRSVFLATKDQLLNVDTNGLVTGDASGKAADDARKQLLGKSFADLSHLPLIVCDLPELASSGYQATRPDIVKRWITSYKAFITAGIKFGYIQVPVITSETATLRTDKGYNIIVDLSGGLESQLDTYKKFLQSQPKAKILEYVDVRVPGKIYYK